VIDKLSNSQLTKNLRFIVAARLPEFDWLLESLDKVQEQVRKSIRKLIGDPKFIYDLPQSFQEELQPYITLVYQVLAYTFVNNIGGRYSL
jgi:hypothetical protein